MRIKDAERNVLLDYVRGIACILIVLYHYTQRYNELFHNSDGWCFRVPWGYMAVATFFVLSGYLAILKDESSTGLKTYIVKKVIRLFPAYWVAIPITFAVTFFYLPSRSVSIKAALFNLTMLESFVGVDLVDGAYWTLANELVFIAFVALVVVVLNKRERIPYFGLAWIAALIVFHFIDRKSLLFAAVGKLIAKQYGHMFVVGADLVFLLHDTGTTKNRIVTGASLLLAVVYQFLTFGWGYTTYFLVSTLIIAICIMVHNRGIVLSDRVRTCLWPLEFLAAISYPLYLLHQNIGYAIMERLRPIITEAEWIIVIPILVVVSVACLIHYCVEKPIAKKLRRVA